MVKVYLKNIATAKPETNPVTKVTKDSPLTENAGSGREGSENAKLLLFFVSVFVVFVVVEVVEEGT